MSETFDARWLALREPADHAARRRSAVALVALRAALRDARAARPSGSAAAARAAVLAVLDLGAGSGSNLRFLAPRLAGPQRWHPCDHDPRLLVAARRTTLRWAAARRRPAEAEDAGEAVDAATQPPAAATLDAFAVSGGCGPGSWSAHVRPIQADLRELDALPFDRVALVTASALLDLVGEAWLRALVARCAAARVAVLWAMEVDGRVRIVPADRADRCVRRDVARHTRRDKGFGPALGARAGPSAAALLAAVGYRVIRSRSDWRIGPSQAALAEAWLAGWAAAASAACPSRARLHAAWLRRRRAALARRRLRVLVGHTDVVGWPAAGVAA